MTPMHENSITIAEGVEWTQAAFAGQIKQLLSAHYLDIMKVDQLLLAAGDIRAAMGLPAHLGKDSVYYPGLYALHCADFEKIDVQTRCGIPTAILHVLGLTEQDGPLMLGSAGWATLIAEFMVWSDRAAISPSAPASPKIEDRPDTADPLPVTRSRNWKWFDKVLAAAAVAGVVGFIVMAGAELKPAVAPSVVRDLAPLPALQPVLPVHPASPAECDSEGGTCAVIETERPGPTLRKLADVAGALPVVKGNRYRVELSVIPVDAADFLPAIPVRQTAASSSPSHADSRSMPRPGATFSNSAKQAKD